MLQASDAHAGVVETSLDRIELSGDFRARYEYLDFDRDDLGNRRRDRGRWRYRLRMRSTADLNDWFDLHFGFRTGGVAKSGNVSLGSGDDFDADGWFVDKAFLDTTRFFSLLRPATGNFPIVTP